MSATPTPETVRNHGDHDALPYEDKDLAGLCQICGDRLPLVSPDAATASEDWYLKATRERYTSACESVAVRLEDVAARIRRRGQNPAEAAQVIHDLLWSVANTNADQVVRAADEHRTAVETVAARRASRSA